MKKAFPPEIAELLDFTEQEGFILIKPKRFLGSDSFGRVAAAVRGLGGEYISMGRDSHFRVATKKA